VKLGEPDLFVGHELGAVGGGCQCCVLVRSSQVGGVIKTPRIVAKGQERPLVGGCQISEGRMLYVLAFDVNLVR